MIIEQNHFVCFACKQPFSENRYLKKELYFEHEKKFYPFCGMCSKYIKKIACHSCGLMIPGCVMEICETEMQRGYDGHNWYHEDCLKKIENEMEMTPEISYIVNFIRESARGIIPAGK